MGDSFEDFLSELGSSKKEKELEFEIFKGTDLGLGSHVPFGIPTRVPSLDLAIGRPGWPAGRVIEILGWEHSGKTTLALAAAASVQRKDGFIFWIDTERTFDPEWARKSGCDPERIIIGETDSIEGVFHIQLKALETREKIKDFSTPMMMITDSITAVPSLETLKRTFDQANRIGTDARAIRDGMRKITSKVSDTKAIAMYINHNIAKTATTPFAKQSTSAGGHALKFYSSLRIECARMTTLKDDNKNKEGMKIKMKMEKNKINSTGNLEAEADLLANGFDLTNNLFDALIQIGEIQRVSTQKYTFSIPNSEETIQFGKKEWPEIISRYSNGIDSVYTWFISKAIEKRFIVGY